MQLPKELTTVTPLSKTIALIMFTLLPIIAFLIGMQFQSNLVNKNYTGTSQNETGCTLEVKICPDGSAVGRSGPNCEFVPCPTTGISENQKEEKFNGKITDINYSCHSDGICEIIIGKKRVIVQRGESLTYEQSGVIWGISLNEKSENNFLGGNVEVFARKLENSRYTLYGSTQYYVKFLDKDFSNGYTCPTNSWVNCMPGPGVDMRYCSTKYLDWAKLNCPGFKDAAY